MIGVDGQARIGKVFPAQRADGKDWARYRPQIGPEHGSGLPLAVFCVAVDVDLVALDVKNVVIEVDYVDLDVNCIDRDENYVNRDENDVSVDAEDVDVDYIFVGVDENFVITRPLRPGGDAASPSNPKDK